MAVLDEPRTAILRFFRMEAREGRGANCELFETGVQPAGLPLDEDEFVYGVYKKRYFFTPRSFIQQSSAGFERIRWEDVRSCSSTHGDGSKVAQLQLADDRTVEVRISEFATGWSGRISQLFHHLIAKRAAQASFGLPLYSIDDFFSVARATDTFLPNREPLLDLDVARQILQQLQRQPGVTKVFLHVAGIQGESPIADGIVVQGTIPAEALVAVANSLGADGVVEASENVKRKVPALPSDERLWHLLFD